MTNTEIELLNVLSAIEGNGSFVTSGVKESVLPGLFIEGIGELGLPVNHILIQELIKQSKKASFGKGSKTVLDTTVRSVWEMDASQLSFRNKNWTTFLQQIVSEAKSKLGLEQKDVKASLYKLLIYEKGDFFLPHKDSEKEAGMFGTLVINLPSKHEGGALIVRFDGKEEVINFSKESDYNISYAAFFADCEHELKKVTSGYRVCLVYNLILSNAPKLIESQIGASLKEVTNLLKEMVKDGFDTLPKVFLLDHEYTSTNFSFDALKLHDLPRTQLLLEAAEKAGYFAKLALVTHYQSGSWEMEYSSRYRRSDPEDGSMGEIFEEYTHIEHWADNDGLHLGQLPIAQENIIGDIEVGEGDPSEEEFEDYTGNAGMTMEYWYHYGAVVFWPKNKHIDLLSTRPIDVQLEWMTYYLDNWENKEIGSSLLVQKMIVDLTAKALEKYDSNDYSIITTVLIKIQDENFVKKNCLNFLSAAFDKINVKNWTELLQHYSESVFDLVFSKVGFSKDIRKLVHLFKILGSITSQKIMPAFLKAEIDQIPKYLSEIDFLKLKEEYNYYESKNASREDSFKTIIAHVLAFSQTKETDSEWIKNVLGVFTQNMERDFVNNVLANVLLSTEKKGILFQELYKVCFQDFTTRIDNKPSPLPDWTRPVPQTKYDNKIWDMLKTFLESPIQNVFDYAKPQHERSQVESAIKSVTIDLKMETIKKGSPHTLRITKTNANYDRELKKWAEDLKLLERLKDLK